MTRKVANGLDLQNQRAVNGSDPVAATDLGTKQYIDNRVGGISYKDEVRAASTGNGALSTAYANGQSLDGVTLATGDRILLKDQSTGSENGIWVVNASGAPTRAVDADAAADLNNATVYVNDGTVNIGREYTQTVKNPTPGTTALVFAQKSSGQAATSGSGAIAVTSGQVSWVPKSGGGLAQDGSGAYIDSANYAPVKRFGSSGNVPAAAAGAAVTMTHNLGSKLRPGEPLLYITATGEVVTPDVILGDNADTLYFGSAITSGQYTYCTGL